MIRITGITGITVMTGFSCAVLLLVLSTGPAWAATLGEGSRAGTTLTLADSGEERAGTSRGNRSILVAPELLSPRANEVLRTYRFTWRAVRGASAYRIEIAGDRFFRDLLYAEESSTTTLRRSTRTLPLGTIFWRVAAIGEYGQIGPPSTPVAIRVDP